MLIEIEKPSKKWFNLDGQLSADFHKAHGQLADWQTWFSEPENELLFRRTYLDWIWDFSDRPLQPHYILIYGRRSEFDLDRTGELIRRRVAHKRHREEFMTFYRLTADPQLSDVVTAYVTTNGRLDVRGIQPCFTTGPETGELALICNNPTTAIAKVPIWTQARRDHVLKRWNHWAEHERQSNNEPRSMQTGE